MMQDIKDDKLTEPNLLDMRIGVPGALMLSKRLVFNGSLSTLGVRNNDITGDGAALQLAEAVLKHPCINKVNTIMMQDIKDGKVAELDLRGKRIRVPGAIVLSKLLAFSRSAGR
eukprot:gene8280-biopygen8372